MSYDIYNIWDHSSMILSIISNSSENVINDVSNLVKKINSYYVSNFMYVPEPGLATVDNLFSFILTINWWERISPSNTADKMILREIK